MDAKFISRITAAVLIAASPLTSLKAETTYEPFPYPGGSNGFLITGIRGYDPVNDNVFITGSYETGTGGNTVAVLYQGSLSAQNGAWAVLNPTFSGQTVTSSTLYGPNSFYYEPSLGAGGVRAVGSYKYSQSAQPAADHGMIYQGTISSGTWTQIDAPGSIAGGGTVINTIAHSNMGDLVVGNFDTTLTEGRAFIYNIATNSWTNLNPNGAASVTAYGIWQNSATSYTIAGGFSDLNDEGLDAGYLVDYDPTDGSLSNYKEFQYENEPLASVISHFDGITLADDGSYHLTGDQISIGTGDELGFFASIRRNEDGSFGEAVWSSIEYPGALVTSGNTVYKDNVLGVYEDGVNPTRSYVATVPEPSAVALLLGAGIAATIALRRRQA